MRGGEKEQKIQRPFERKGGDQWGIRKREEFNGRGSRGKVDEKSRTLIIRPVLDLRIEASDHRLETSTVKIGLWGRRKGDRRLKKGRRECTAYSVWPGGKGRVCRQSLRDGR